MITGMVSAEKTVTIIPTKPEYSGKNRIDLRPKRVAAYCRVSTDREEQEHSFEAQKQKYTDMIMMGYHRDYRKKATRFYEDDRGLPKRKNRCDYHQVCITIFKKQS